MKTLNAKASQILDTLTNGVDFETVKRIDNVPETFMAVVVERINENCYSVGHYFEQEGDRMSDPEVVFYRSAEGWHPAAVTMHPTGYYQETIVFADGEIVGFRPRALNDLVRFCNVWMMNIQAQQGKELKSAA